MSGRPFGPQLGQTIDTLFQRFERGEISRRQAVLLALTSLATATGAEAGAAAEAPAAEPVIPATELNHIALRVRDLDRSEAFYRNVLGLETARSSSFNRFLTCGPHFVALFRGDEAKLDHYAFSWPDYSQAEAARRLRAAGIEPRLQGNRIYFDDPDGHTLQVSWEEDWPGRRPRPSSSG